MLSIFYIIAILVLIFSIISVLSSPLAARSFLNIPAIVFELLLLLFVIYETPTMFMAFVFPLFGSFFDMFGVTYLVFDGIFLWFALGALAILTLVTMENEKPAWFSVVLVVTLLGLQIYSPFHPITLAYQNPIPAISLIALYFVIGTGWIVAKWYSHVHMVRRKVIGIKDTVITGMKAKHPSENYFTEDDRFTVTGQIYFYNEAARRVQERSLPLKVSDYKSQLYMWWACWPLSLFWTFCSDPVRRLWWFVYAQLGSVLQNISNKASKFD